MNIPKNSYGFTYKIMTKVKPDEHDYEPILRQLKNRNGDVVHVSYEKDSQNRLHIHGIVRFIDRKPYLQSLTYPSTKSSFEPLYDEDRWLAYCTKVEKGYDNTQYMF